MAFSCKKQQAEERDWLYEGEKRQTPKELHYEIMRLHRTRGEFLCNPDDEEDDELNCY